MLDSWIQFTINLHRLFMCSKSTFLCVLCLKNWGSLTRVNFKSFEVKIDKLLGFIFGRPAVHISTTCVFQNRHSSWFGSIQINTEKSIMYCITLCSYSQRPRMGKRYTKQCAIPFLPVRDLPLSITRECISYLL